jgi:tetratricopeptide (TPR) repeat protein
MTTEPQERYAGLSPVPARLYRCLGLLQVREVDPALAAAACELEPAEAEQALGALVEVTLLERAGTDRYRLPDAARDHARERGQREESDAVPIVRRWVDGCLEWTALAEDVLTRDHNTLPRDVAYPPAVPAPFSSPAGEESAAEKKERAKAALAWLTGRLGMLMDTVRAAAEAGLHAAAWQLTDAMWPVFLRRAPYEEWITAHAIGLASAEAIRDRAGQIRMLTSGAVGLRMAGQIEEAQSRYQRALAMAKADGRVRDQAQALSGLANCHRAQGHPRAARNRYAQALVLREEVDYRRGAALSRYDLGQLAVEDRNIDEAVPYLTRAHAVLVDEQDFYDAARARALLGFALGQRQDSRAAGRAHLRQAVDELTDAGSDRALGKALGMLGQLAHADHDDGTAREYYERALTLLHPDHPGEAEDVRRHLAALPADTSAEEPHV